MGLYTINGSEPHLRKVKETQFLVTYSDYGGGCGGLAILKGSIMFGGGVLKVGTPFSYILLVN